MFDDRKELKEEEKKCTDLGNLEDAERITGEINEMLEKEILLSNLNMIEQNKSEFESIKDMNDQRISKFNKEWDSIITSLTQSSKKIEEELLEQHQKEKQKLESGLQQMEIPEPKFSSDLLNRKVRLRHLIKCKKYGPAKILKAGN